MFLQQAATLQNIQTHSTYFSNVPPCKSTTWKVYWVVFKLTWPVQEVNLSAQITDLQKAWSVLPYNMPYQQLSASYLGYHLGWWEHSEHHNSPIMCLLCCDWKRQQELLLHMQFWSAKTRNSKGCKNFEVRPYPGDLIVQKEKCHPELQY